MAMLLDAPPHEECASRAAKDLLEVALFFLLALGEAVVRIMCAPSEPVSVVLLLNAVLALQVMDLHVCVEYHAAFGVYAESVAYAA